MDAPTEGHARPASSPEHVPSKSDECSELRRKARRYEEMGEYRALLRATNRKSCWGPSYRTEYVSLRVEALLETGNYADCIELGEYSRSEEVMHFVKLCQDEIRN